nr:MAG TPA: Tape measure domain protein [Caudoviricetes sp.]
MAADEILGISGQMDISDIQQSFDNLINNLNQLGVKTNEVSSKMTKALNDISHSAASESEKTTKSIEAYKQAIAEINKSLETTPEAIKKLASEASTAEATVDKLKKRLAETAQDSPKWNEINEQLKTQQNLVTKLNSEYESMLGTFSNTQQYVGSLNAAIETMNAGRSISTAATGASATAHIGAAAAVGTEAVAHAENSSKIVEETEATKENTQQKLRLTENADNYVYTAKMEAEAIDAVSKRLREGQSSQEEYIKSKESGLNFAKSLVAQIEEEKQKIAALADVYQAKVDNGTYTVDDKEAYAQGVKEAEAQIKEYRQELTVLNKSLDELDSAHHAASRGIIEQSEATQNLNSSAKNAEIIFGEEKATIEGVTEVLRLDYEELKKLKAEYASFKAAKLENSDEAKQNLKDQQALNEHIAEGRNVLKQLGTTYEDASKKAKEVKNETKEIGKEGEKSAKKVGNIFSSLKKSLKGVQKGDFSGLFSFIGKIGAWGAALGAVGKALYELTIQAEQFRAALQPLSHYIDSNKLSEVRQDILALTGTTTKSAADMAEAATQFVKVWDSLSGSSEALITMVKSSNEFGALSGKTSKESAKYLSNLASEYHMTAEEATQASAIIATAARNSTDSFEGMADALMSAGSTASMYKVSFKDMASLIGYSSTQFGGAQKAASKMSMLLMNMERLQNDKYKPSVVGMIQALQNLKVALNNGELSEKTFQGRIRQTALYFINNADAIATYGKSIDDPKAKTELLADANKRASTNVAKLKNAWDGLLTSFNANLTPILTGVLNFFNRIIGGAQRTADELDYLKNYDRIHKGQKRLTTTKGNNVINRAGGVYAASPQNVFYQAGAEGANLEKYQRQRDMLNGLYKKQYEYYKKRFSKASENALLNMTNHAMVGYWGKNKDKLTEYDATKYNAWLRNRRANQKALNQKTNHTSIDNGGKFIPEETDEEKNARNYREQQAEQQAKELAEKKKLEWELYVAEQETAIAKTHEASEKETKQRKLDFEKKKHQIEEEEETLRQKNIQLAKANYDRNPKNEKKEGFYARGLDKNITLNDEQRKLIDTKTNLLTAQQAEYEYQQMLKSIEDYRAYLKKYGDLESQKLAIIEEYNQKIKDARSKGNEYEAAAFEEEKKQKSQELDFEKIKKSIDWETVFNDINSQTTSALKDLKIKLKVAINANDISAEDAKTLAEKIREIEDKISERTDIFAQILPGLREQKRLTEESYEVQREYNKALEEQVNMRMKLSEAENTIQKSVKDKTGKDISSKEIASMSKEDYLKMLNLDPLSEAGKNAAKEFDKLVISSTNLGKAQENLTAAQIKLANFNNAIKDKKGLKGITNAVFNTKGMGLTDVMSLINQNAQSMNNLVKDIGLGNTEFGEAVGHFSEGVGGFQSAIMSLASGDVMGFVDGVVNGFQGFGHMLGIGGGDADKVNKLIKNLTEKNETLTEAIERLTQEISESGGWQSIQKYEDAQKLQKEKEANLQKMYNARRGYDSAHHSFNYYWNPNKISQEKKNKISDELGRDWNGDLSDIRNAKEAHIILTYAGDEIKNTGKGGYGKAVYERLSDWANEAETLDELTSNLYETLTQISFESMRDDFVSSLMDMTKDAQDFSNDFSKMLMQGVLSSRISNELGDDLQAFYDEWGKRAKANGGKLTDDDIEFLRNMYKSITEKGLTIRDETAKVTDYADAQSEQTATGKGIEAITADQASSLIGIGYAIQIAQEQGNEVRKAIAVDVTSLKFYAEQTASNVSEMRDIQYQGLEQLEAINKNTAPIILIREDIASMYKLMKDKY